MYTGTLADALEELKEMVDAETEPVLSDATLYRLLRRARRADRYGAAPESDFQAATVYAVGDEVIPTVDNGHYYTVTVAGTTAGSEPVWPTGSGATVTSGSVTFAEAGESRWERTWDLDAAAGAAWRLKEGKAANRAQHLLDGRANAADYLVLNCRRMAEHYENRLTASVPALSRRGRHEVTL